LPDIGLWFCPPFVQEYVATLLVRASVLEKLVVGAVVNDTFDQNEPRFGVVAVAPRRNVVNVRLVVVHFASKFF
jgi:hypothetical protein